MNGEKKETNEMSDNMAEAIEAGEKFINICSKYDMPAFLSFISNYAINAESIVNVTFGNKLNAVVSKRSIERSEMESQDLSKAIDSILVSISNSLYSRLNIRSQFSQNDQ